MTLPKLTCMAGSQPSAVFLLGPGKGNNTKPANRMGPLRVCLLQEEEGGSLPVQPDASRTRQGHTVDVSVTLWCLTVFFCNNGDSDQRSAGPSLAVKSLMVEPPFLWAELKLNAALFPRTSPVTCFDLTG